MNIRELKRELESYNGEDEEQDAVFLINGEISGSRILRDGRREVSVIIGDTTKGVEE